MTPELKQKWIDALRSGKYKQGQNKLCVVDEPHGERIKYCCLGVLLDISDLGEWDNHGHYILDEDEVSNAMLDAELDRYTRTKFGITEREEGDLIGMNDGLPSQNLDPQPFSTIAQWIEDNL